jgi:hypothetical protein
MNDQPKTNLHTTDFQEKNRQTQLVHQKEVLWQITVPAIVSLLAFLIVAGLAIFAGVQGSDAGIHRWGAISLIWLILPMLMVTLILIVIAGGILYGVIKLIGVIPTYSYKLQNLLWKVQEKLKAISDTAAKPVIKVSSFQAALRTLLRK